MKIFYAVLIGVCLGASFGWFAHPGKCARQCTICQPGKDKCSCLTSASGACTCVEPTR